VRIKILSSNPVLLREGLSDAGLRRGSKRETKKGWKTMGEFSVRGDKQREKQKIRTERTAKPKGKGEGGPRDFFL